MGKLLKLILNLEDQPEFINTDPYGEGWIIKVELSDPSELDGLLDSVTYQAQITVINILIFKLINAEFQLLNLKFGIILL